MSEKLYYLYADVTDCGNVFYIGKGNQRRAFEYMERNTKRHATIARRFGQNRKVICSSTDEQEILALEIALIADYRLNFFKHRDNVFAGNLTDGGEVGSRGTEVDFSETHRKNLSIAKKRYWATHKRPPKVQDD